ncbi:MAG: class I SAM-dependent methyltransferase [Bacteroidales bacterium]|nr:class I SAM-dependent methyltransferase [Bacteroidales bacterium]MDD4208783.1 class I SAM-dependent methyltransferase [Bacteroidales bacterium]
MKNINQKNIWNELAYKKSFTTPLQMDLVNKYIQKDATVLDVGCGYGRSLNELHLNGFSRLYGIDFSEKMIERAKSQYPFLNLEVQVNKNINFPDNTFDAVLLFAVLTCISQNTNQLHLIKEIKRVLKPGGIIYINDFLLNTDERNRKRYELFYKKYKLYGIFELAEGLILRHHSLEWTNKCIDVFSPLFFHTFTFPTMNGNHSNAYSFIGSK